jgi:hypothetical protein
MSITNMIEDFQMENTEQDPADRRLVVRFSYEARPDMGKSSDEGRTVYKDVEYVHILIPGDKTLSVFRPVMPSDKARFSTQYARWQQGRGEAQYGTPLAGWPGVTESQRKELEYFNLKTVEQLAGVADNFAGQMMGVMQLKQMAQKYIDASKERAPTIKILKELEERDNTIAAMQSQLDRLAALIENKGK